MTRILGLYTMLVHATIVLLLRLALALDRHERWAVKTARRLRGSLLRLWRRWAGITPPRRRQTARGRRPWNRTPPETELAVLRIHC
jgi:hypothetical protein